MAMYLPTLVWIDPQPVRHHLNVPAQMVKAKLAIS